MAFTARPVEGDAIGQMRRLGLPDLEQRGQRLHRGAGTHGSVAPPFPPARAVEQGRQDRLDHDMPETLAPVAAFEGRRTLFPLTVEGDPVSMTLLDGTLRAVAAERPAARLILEGPGAAVRTLMLSLAGIVELSVPPYSLAAEALHLADGVAPVPRRTGAPELPHDGLSIQAAFAHIIGHLTGVMLHLAPLAGDPESGPGPVHQMRVAVRRARSALALFPPVADGPRAADSLKRLGHMLGPARDWDVFMTETAPPVEAVLTDERHLPALLRAGTRRRRAARAALSEYLTGAEFRLCCLELACLAAAEPPEPEIGARPLTEFAAEILRVRWRKLARRRHLGGGGGGTV